ncbi:phage integrase SAM-like domain-containing protein, partial [Salmonella enterica]|nr:phage integrase SAM-like domain-containing protein [Salmonella enterica]
MATDFALLLQRFLTGHLAGLRGASPNTVASCRDTFKLLIIYLRDQKAILPEKLTLSRIDVDTITEFLNWLESSRQNSVSTRN